MEPWEKAKILLDRISITRKRIAPVNKMVCIG
jgi:hypothetical protein